MEERYKKQIERNLDELEGFTQTIRDINMEPSVKILSKNLRIAGNRYAKLFGIKPEDKIVAIKLSLIHI